MPFTFLKLPLFSQPFHLFLAVFRLLPAPLCSSLLPRYEQAFLSFPALISLSAF